MFEYFYKYVIINIRGENMDNIINFSNIIKYDFNRCTQCRKCVYKCPTRALSLINGRITFKESKCISCKECIKICDYKSLYYNVNDGILEGVNTTAIIPINSNQEFLRKKHGNVITYELGEKVKVIETAFEMENKTSKLILDEIKTPMIISDILNFDLLLKVKFPNLVKYYSKIKSQFYLSSYLYRLINSNKNVKIVAYGIPFESKSYFNNKKIIDEICDIPFKYSSKYNILDILNIYKDLCKLEIDVELDQLEIKNNVMINMYNKNLDVKVLFIREVNLLASIEINKYDFVFVCDKDKYNLNNDLLKDEEVNKLYKDKLKSPGSTMEILEDVE